MIFFLGRSDLFCNLFVFMPRYAPKGFKKKAHAGVIRTGLFNGIIAVCSLGLVRQLAEQCVQLVDLFRRI